MYHPMTKEKERLTEMAEKIRAMKREIKYQGHLQSILRDRELREYVLPCIVKTPQELAKLQQSRDRLKRAYRHRHVAYCLVRQGITGIDDFSARQNCIEANMSATKLNMNLVNMHRMRLLTEIAAAYSDYTDELVRERQQQFITESAPVPEDVWANLSNLIPLATFYPEKGGKAPVDLLISDFEIDTSGNFTYTIREPGYVVTKEVQHKVKEDDTLNLDFSDALPGPGEPWKCKRDFCHCLDERCPHLDVTTETLCSIGELCNNGDKCYTECYRFVHSKCPYFKGLKENEDECELGGLCTEDYLNFGYCCHYQQAQSWN